MYSVLFANQTGAYVRLGSTVNSMKGDVAAPVHGADVGLVMQTSQFNPTDSTSIAVADTIYLTETTTVTAGDTVSYYYANVPILSGQQYEITASKQGYDPVSATVTVPYSFVTVPDAETYARMRSPHGATLGLGFNVNLSAVTAAEFVQLLIEYRGFDDEGQFHVGSVNVTPYDSTDPFQETTSYLLSVSVGIDQYSNAFDAAKQLASSLKESHLYADIIVTQIDDPLYRFYITSGRWSDPLAMRTDKIIFSNLANGVGVVGAAAVDTTRIYLF